jgi:hypothetical protein
MHYCNVHQRGLVPAEYDGRTRCAMPPQWHPLSRYAVRMAWQLAEANHCAGALTFTVVRCDRCAPPMPLEESPYAATLAPPQPPVAPHAGPRRPAGAACHGVSARPATLPLG